MKCPSCGHDSRLPAHGTPLEYRRGCRCRECKDGWNSYCREYELNRKERNRMRTIAAQVEAPTAESDK